MKLIDLLVQELPKRGGWPEGVTHIEQDYDRELRFYGRGEPRTGIILDELAVDHRKIGASDKGVTKSQYEAALAASDDWIDWHGGECPVDSDAIVEVKYRHPSSYQFNNDRAGDFYWPHDGLGYDTITYRLRQPAKSEQVRDDAAEADDEADLNECIGQDVDMPEWNGDGLPPVGIICQAKVPRSVTGWEWRKVKVVESGIPGAEKEVLVYDLETTIPAWTDEFRPLRTEAEKAREKLAASLHVAACASPIELNGIGPLYFKLADAIISGSVFGTTFKAGK